MLILAGAYISRCLYWWFFLVYLFGDIDKAAEMWYNGGRAVSLAGAPSTHSLRKLQSLRGTPCGREKSAVACSCLYALTLACARTIVLRLQPFGCLFTAQGSRTRSTLASRPQLLMLRSALRPPRQPKIHCIRGSEALFTCHRRGEII